MPHRHESRSRRHAPGRPRRGRQGDQGRRRGLARLVADALGGARGRPPARGRAARRPVADDAERGHDARPVEDRAPGRDRRRLRAHRLLALQRHFMRRIYEEQPISSPGLWNRMEYRPLEGFVFAVSPFNFTAIGGNLPTSAALMGNTVVWKPATTAAYSAHFLMQLLREAGLPDGVINLVYGPGARIGDAALASPDLAGIHFTGSTGVFQSMWRTVGTTSSATATTRASSARPAARTSSSPTPRADVDARRDRDRPRLVRVPGPEVLGGLARLRPAAHVAGAEGALGRARSTRSRWATSATSRTSWAPSSTRNSFRTQKEAIEEARPTRTRTSLVGGERTTTRKAVSSRRR